MLNFQRLLVIVLAVIVPVSSAAARSGYRRSTVKAPSTATTRHRSTAARDAFQRSQPCPSTGRTSGACPGHLVDHVVPLKRGGADAPSNMQWQTTEQAKAKDKVE